VSSIAIRFENGKLELLDQQQLPHQEIWVDATHPDNMESCIKQLKVRGAPLIGVAAALCLGEWARSGVSEDEFKVAAQKLRKSRPTAVNLMLAIDRLTAMEFDAEKVFLEAQKIYEEDQQLCDRIAENGSKLIEDGDNIITHCNTGGLATAGVGTALGVIRKAWEQGKRIHVCVDETRPLLQGGRLTTWELEKLGIPYTLICDNMAASLMAAGKINKAIVGSDRIALNGDFANKIGTYGLAVHCYYHRIPFFVAAPVTTIDGECESGQQIPIEERNDFEVRGVKTFAGDVEWAPSESEVYNPAFDVTPSELVSQWILDTGNYSLVDIRENALKELV
jgi:methylthioribose-1-phosphate isomerase